MWLRDDLPKEISNVRIITYGYNSELQANKARSIFADHSTRFISRLKEMRRSARVSTPIICNLCAGDIVIGLRVV